MSYGSTQYDRQADRALPPRDVEAAAFAFVNRSLESAESSADRIAALARNHRLWSLLITDIGLSSNALPPILKKDLVSIGSWSMAYSIAAMGRDLPLKPLLDINIDMIEALKQGRPVPQAPGRAPNAARMSVPASI